MSTTIRSVDAFDVIGRLRRRGTVGVPWRLVGTAVDGSAGAAAALAVGCDPVGAGIVGIVGAAALAGTGLRADRLSLVATDDIPAVVLRCGVLSLVAVQSLGAALVMPRAPTLAAALIGAVLAVRVLLYAAANAARARGRGVEDTIVLGAGPVACQLADALRCRPQLGLRPIGFVDRVDSVDDVLPLLGGLEDLPALLRGRGVRRVVIAFGAAREAETVAVVRACQAHKAVFFVLPRFFELGSDSRDDALGFPLVRLRAPAHVSWRAGAKRAFDLAVAIPTLAIAAPVLAACALAVRLSSPGPAVFRQQRVGLDGRPVDVLKFRSMHVNDDQATTWSVDGDDRVTAVGRFLRPTHLDELPQLWNVVRGDMSIVGPRPERPFFAEQFSVEIPGYADRHRVRTGITGWAQVNGLWGDTSIAARVRCDNQYIERWSLWRDVAILFRTFPTVLGRRVDAG